jgi:hypothetical protein
VAGAVAAGAARVASVAPARVCGGLTRLRIS